MENVSSRKLLLDLLWATSPNPLPVSLLINIGEIFSLNENAIRVNLNRLQAKDLINKDERGYYGIGSANTPRKVLFSEWQDDASRTKDWDGQWLLLSPAPKLTAKQVQALAKAAERLGFKELPAGQWLRPNNLNLSPQELSSRLQRLSSCENFMLSVCTEVFHPEENFDVKNLWPIKEIEAHYRSLISQLEKGIEESRDRSAMETFKESYLLGGETIHSLIRDPLLPEEMIEVGLRRHLSELMKEYDEVSRPRWNAVFQEYKVRAPIRNIDANLYTNV